MSDRNIKMDKYTEDLINKFSNIINTLYFQGYIKDIDAQIQDTLQKIRILIEDTIKEKKEMSIKIDAYRYFIENRIDDISNMPYIISKYSMGRIIKEHYIDIVQPIFEALDNNYCSKNKIKEKIKELNQDCLKCKFRGEICNELCKNNQCVTNAITKSLKSLL